MPSNRPSLLLAAFVESVSERGEGQLDIGPPLDRARVVLDVPPDVTRPARIPVHVKFRGIFPGWPLSIWVRDPQGNTVYRRASSGSEAAGVERAPDATWEIVHEVTHLFVTSGEHVVEIHLGGKTVARLPFDVVAGEGQS